MLDLDVNRAAPICLQLLVNPAMQVDSDASYAVLQLLLRLFGQRHEVPSRHTWFTCLTSPEATRERGVCRGVKNPCPLASNECFLMRRRAQVMRTLGQVLLITEQEVLFTYKSTSAICQQMSRLNVRLAACEHKLIEAMHLFDKMQLEQEALDLAQGELLGGH